MKIHIQKEIHSAIINQVDHTTPLWQQGDGMITHESDIALIAYGADCGIIAFWDDEKIGVCHAGWRGYTQGLIKAMVEQFPGGNCFVGPFLHEFEILKDSAYDTITAYAGTQFIAESSERVTFQFKQAIAHELQGMNVVYDPRCTFDHSELGSWRRDKATGDGTQNRVVVWRTEGVVHTKVFHPRESIRDYFAQQIVNK